MHLLTHHQVDYLLLFQGQKTLVSAANEFSLAKERELGGGELEGVGDSAEEGAWGDGSF